MTAEWLIAGPSYSCKVSSICCIKTPVGPWRSCVRTLQTVRQFSDQLTKKYFLSHVLTDVPQWITYNLLLKVFVDLRFLNNTMSTQQVIEHQIRWEYRPIHERWVGKDLEGSGRWMFQSNIWAVIWRTGRKTSVRTSSNPTEIRTTYIPNRECYRSIYLLSERCVREPVLSFLSVITKKCYEHSPLPWRDFIRRITICRF